MIKQIAQIVSFVFHPLLMASYIFAIILFTYPYISIPKIEYKFFLLAIVFTCTYLIPSLVMVGLKKAKIISSFRIPDRKERIIPFIICIIIYIYTYVLLLKQVEFYGQLFPNIILVITCSLILVLTISFWWKISAHTIGMGGLTGLVFWIHFSTSQYYYWMIILTIIFSMMVISARLYLKAHSQFQVYIAYASGILISLYAYPWLENNKNWLNLF